MTRNLIRVRLVLLVLLATLVVGLARTSWAAPGRKGPAGRAGGKENAGAKAHFQKAEKAFNMGKFDEALVGYEAAYDAKPLPAFLFNIAQCHRNMGNAERALFFYQRYLSLDRDPPFRKLVDDLIAEMQKVLGEQEAEAARKAAAAAPPATPPPLPTAAPAPPPPVVLAPTPRPKPIHHRWWFWGAAGVVLTAAALAVFIKRDGPLPQGKLGFIDGR